MIDDDPYERLIQPTSSDIDTYMKRESLIQFST